MAILKFAELEGLGDVESCKDGQCKVKPLKTRDALILQQPFDNQVEYLQEQTEDELFSEALPKLDSNYIHILMHLQLGASEFKGLPGGEVQTAMQAWINNEAINAEGAPYWGVPVYKAVRNASTLSEEEQKN